MRTDETGTAPQTHLWIPIIITFGGAKTIKLFNHWKVFTQGDYDSRGYKWGFSSGRHYDVTSSPKVIVCVGGTVIIMHDFEIRFHGFDVYWGIANQPNYLTLALRGRCHETNPYFRWVLKNAFPTDLEIISKMNSFSGIFSKIRDELPFTITISVEML